MADNQVPETANVLLSPHASLPVGGGASEDADGPTYAKSWDELTAAPTAPAAGRVPNFSDTPRTPPPRRPPPHPGAPPAPGDGHPKPTAYSSAYARAGKPPGPKELSFGQALGQGAVNFIPSAVEGVKGMVGSVTHLDQTLKNLGQMGTGALSQISGALDVNQDPKAKAQNEALIRAVEDHYKNAYGSWKGFKQNLATDPFGVLMDASMIADPAAGLLGKLGEAGKLGAVGSQAAKVASKALSNVNPITLGVNAAKVPGKVAGSVLRGSQAITTGVPGEVLGMVNKVGESTNPAVRSTFSDWASGKGQSADFAQMVQDAVKQSRDEVSAKYLANKQNLGNVKPNFETIQDAIDKVKNKIQYEGEYNPDAFEASNNAMAKVERLVSRYRDHPNAAFQSLDGVDNLKQAIYAVKDATADDTAAGHVMNTYHGVKQALMDADPQYAKMMEDYQTGQRHVNNLVKTLGAGPNAAATATFVKSMKALKSPVSRNLLQHITEKDPRIGAALAGNAVQPWFRGGISLGEAAAGSLIPSIVGAANPAAAGVGAVGGLLASSPKIAGAIQHGLGTASIPLKAAEDMARNPILQKGSYYASRPQATKDVHVAAPQQSPAGQDGQPGEAGEQNGAAPEGGSPIFDKNGVPIFGDGHAPPDQESAPSDVEKIKNQIGTQESGGHKDPYSVIGPASSNGDRPYGKYQVMGKNIPEWTETILGKRMTPEEFLASPEAQEAVVSSKLEEYYKHTGNARDAAAMWHSGKTYDIAKAEHRHDVLGTRTTDYADRVADGRVGRASGGQISDVRRHEYLVDRLMRAAKDAKKQTDKTTEPLLNVPDEHIVKALDVAQRAI